MCFGSTQTCYLFRNNQHEFLEQSSHLWCSYLKRVVTKETRNMYLTKCPGKMQGSAVHLLPNPKNPEQEENCMSQSPSFQSGVSQFLLLLISDISR